MSEPERVAAKCRSALLASLLLCAAQVYAQHDHHSSGARPQASKEWTTLPTVTVLPGRAPGQPIRVASTGVNFATLTLQTPETLEPKAMTPLEPGNWKIERSDAGAGGHLWVTAKGTQDGRTVRASSHLFLPMKHQVPTEMLKHAPEGLQLIPLRLPEHGGIRERSTWRFLAQFDGTPLPGAMVKFETSGNSQQTLTADASGIVAVTFPRDFRDENLNPENPMASRQSFVLALNHRSADHDYLTAYNHFYLPDRMRERSLLGGIGALFVGMALATPLLRRKEKKNA